MRTGVSHQVPVLRTKFFVTCGRKRNFKNSPVGLQIITLNARSDYLKELPLLKSVL